MKRAYGQLTDLLLLALGELGPSTAVDVAEHLDIDSEDARKALSRMALLPLGRRRIHIKDHAMDQLGQKQYPRRVFALGARQNATRPPRTPQADVTRKYYQCSQRALAAIYPGIGQREAVALRAEIRRREKATQKALAGNNLCDTLHIS